MNIAGNGHSTSAEWNVFADPQAAAQVFDSGIQIYLVPLDATNQVALTAQDTPQWRHGGQAANSAADMYDMLLKSSASMGAWDLMTAAIMLDPALCDFQPLHLDVITDAGDNQGQTLSRGPADPNSQVCLHPHADAIRQTLAWVFSNSK